MSCPKFKDGKRSIDFILVYETSDNDQVAERRANFLKNLESLGIHLESEPSSSNECIVYVKVHTPADSIANYWASVLCVDLERRTYNVALPSNEQNALPTTSRRAMAYAQSITAAERIMIAYQILIRCVYGPNLKDYGLKRLMQQKVFVDAFPLHDADYKTTTSGSINDRQILATQWGALAAWKKPQPLNLIEKYYGTQYAYYFAWLGFYVRMLIPPAAISILVILYGLVTTRLNEIGDVCTSDMLLCPRCHYSRCKREALKSSCLFAHLNYLFDNAVVVAFAIVMSLWSTVFMEMWQREDSVLRLQWNVTPYEYLIVPRFALHGALWVGPQYTEQTDELKFCPISGTLEPHMSKRSVTYRYALTSVCILLLLAVMVLATFAVMVYRVSVNLAMVRSVDVDVITGNTGLIASATGALMSAVFIVIFKWFYEKVALKLTELENHRTQDAFVNAYIYKSYALAFTNNYAPLFYIAFFKGKFFTHPGDLRMWSSIGGLDSDICDPTGCVVDLAMLMFTIMAVKAIASNVQQVVAPILVNLYNAYRSKIWTSDDVPQWEREYLLAPTAEFFIIDEYMDMVIQYGFVNFFVVGFPVAPLFALLNNAVELRVDASKIVKSYRRPVPNKVAGLGAWFGILQAMTYIGVVTNALVIAFTSNIMEKIVHRMSRQHGQTFLNYTLSAYDFDEFVVLLGRQGNLGGRPANLCYYRGKRNPPGHPMEYANRKEYWKELAIKMVAVLVFEHVIVTIKGFLAYAIPDVPFAVKQRVAHRENVKKKLRMRELHEEYLKRRRRKSED